MVGASPHPDENTPCSRPESREARHIVQTHIVTLSEEAGHGELAPSCPLSPHNDVLAAHEAAKRRLSGAVWKCGLCGKQFRSERHLDLHMHRKHADASPAGATSCLADECDLLRCPSWVKRLGDAAAACTEGALAVRREHCAALMHSCAFGPLFAQLEHEYCANLTCSYRQQLIAGHIDAHPPGHTRGGLGLLAFGVLGVAAAAVVCCACLGIPEARAFRAAESGSVVRQTATRQRLYQPPRPTE